jgi:hypothetical protein
MKYPGRIIKQGESDASIVAALKTKLNEMMGVTNDPEQRLDPANPTFGPRMKALVKLFQTRHVDTTGRPLKADGEVGSLTWEALFGPKSVPTSTKPAGSYLTRVLEIAAGEEAKKVRERPRNSNKGPEVSEYLRRTGVPPGLAWCCAFIYWSFDEAAKAMDRDNPMFKTAGCLNHWNNAERAGARRIKKSQAVNDTSLVRAGQIFIMDFGGGKGHTGLIERVDGGMITTIEGNTDASRTREGGGVYRLTRKIVEVNKGFVDYGGM